ncbi:MAG: OmpH family outer membrane protein [Thermodesulfobacteriota bacterium]
MVKLGVGLLLTLSLVLMPLLAGAADVKIGVVDSSDILGKSAEGKKIQDILKRKSDELGRDLQRQDQEIGRMVEDFRKQAAVMKEDAKKKRQEELNKRASEFQRRVQEADKQLAQLEQKEKEPLLNKLQQAVNAVAQENKLDLVLDRRLSGLLFFSPALDITEKVRSRFGR